jgi:amidase
MYYRPLLSFALASTLALTACSKEEAKPYAVEEVPLSQISADLASGKTTSVAVTKAYIDRIKKYDGALHSVILVAPDALDQAAASDKRRKEGHALGPLDGIPVLFKDNIDVAGYPTTAGSYALIDNKPAQDSEVAKRLRAAGVVMLGKANTSQWAGLRTTKSFNGSTVGGSPKNPYDLTRSPAGSSSGPGIATAASLAAATVGTDTAGSIVAPSNVNGDVGFRPTVALISRHGIVPVSSTDDMSGPIGRNVRDVAMMLNAMAGSDPADPASQDADAHKTDYTQALSTDALKGKRIGVIRGFSGYNDETKPVLDAALEVMKAQGAEIVEIPADMFEDLSQEQRTIMLYDIKQDMAEYLSHAPAAVKTRTLADLIEFNKTEEHEKQHSQDLFEAAEATTGRDNPEYIKTAEYAKRRAGEDGYLKAMRDYNVSALVLPTGAPAGKIPPDESNSGHPAVVHEKGARPPSGSATAAMAGYPELNVPMGLVNGMPVGISFIGEPWSEATLLGYGYAYEQASHARVPPTAYKNATPGT